VVETWQLASYSSVWNQRKSLSLQVSTTSQDLILGLMLIYPVLSFDMACWMPSSQMGLLRAESIKSVPSILQSKQYATESPLSAAIPDAPRRIDVLSDKVDRSKSWYQFGFLGKKKKDTKKTQKAPSSLSMTSRMIYFNDPILAPECTFTIHTRC
jgi:hypothetical protein